MHFSNNKFIQAYLNTSIVTDLNVLNEGSTSYNNTSTFVSTNKRQLRGQWPVAVNRVEVCVAHTGVFDVNENLVGARLLNWNLLVYNSWVELAW